ncbi:MAG TPA: peptidoglycan editing factor PgeF [Steroidobacteraceae bacterium]|nr:peptidoglycan editing factor PgeF [Steroidobacteraceae bacterium]
MMSSSPAPLPATDFLPVDWPAPPGVRAAFTLRGGGVSPVPWHSLNLGGHVGDDVGRVRANRAAVRQALQLPAEPLWLNQVHGVRVADLDRETAPLAAADAALTRQGGRVLAILVADCLPVLFAATDGSLIAAAHAGWRGLAAGVLEATVRATGKNAAELLAWLGPSIGPRRFEVGDEVRAAFLAADPAASRCFRPNDRQRWLCDLPALARARLTALGVRSLHGVNDCTFEDAARFFSYRRDGQTGRMAALLWRESAA